MRYAIRVRGHLDGTWSDWFGGLAITNLAGGDALLTGELADQAALHGVLTQVRDLGLPLLAVTRVGPTPDEGGGPASGRPDGTACA